MTKKKISKSRLVLNGIGCFGIAILCLPLGFVAIITLTSGTNPMVSDPDGAGKVLGIEIFFGLIGAIALLSLIHTVMLWRELPTHKSEI